MKALIGYFPVIHAGHLEVCRRQNPDALYLLGKDLIREFPKLERDIRALVPDQIKIEAEALKLAASVRILEKDDLSELDKYSEIILLNDEVGRELAEKYLQNKNITWENSFLRWNQMNAITKTPPQSDKKISTDDFDKKMIELSYKSAEKSSDWWRRIGAVLIKDGNIISTRYNKHAITENTAYIDGEPRSNFDAGKAIAELVIFEHAEASLIAEAAKNGVQTLGAEIYVTVFPCPSCAMAIANAGIKKVFYKEGYSLLDAERILKNANVKLIRISDN